ncbi:MULTISPECIES: Vmc-like lipoprotein signal peptide domain-containing protein [Enterobacterales]
MPAQSHSTRSVCPARSPACTYLLTGLSVIPLISSVATSCSPK